MSKSTGGVLVLRLIIGGVIVEDEELRTEYYYTEETKN